MTERSGPAEGAKGVVEEIKGRLKEAVGAITGDDAKTREGHARGRERSQQDK